MALSAVLGGLGALASFADARSGRKAAEKAMRQRQEAIDFVKSQAQKSQDQIFNLYPQIQEQNRNYLQAALNSQFGTLGPQANLFQQSNVGAQNILGTALGNMNNSILGTGQLTGFGQPVQLDFSSYMPAMQEMANPNLLALNYGGVPRA